MTHLRKLLDEAGPSEPRRYTPPDRLSIPEILLITFLLAIAFPIGFIGAAIWGLKVLLVCVGFVVGGIMLIFWRWR